MKRSLLILLLATVLAACAPAAPSDDRTVQTAVAALLTQQAPAPEGDEAPVDEVTVDPNIPSIPTPETLPGLPPEASCVPLGTDRAVAIVTEIISGDSIMVRVGSEEFKIRYIGIDDGDSPQAKEANRAMVEGQQVVLVRDESDTDEYGRYLRYVIVGDAFVNLRLLQQGHAGVSPESPDTACERLFNSVP